VSVTVPLPPELAVELVTGPLDAEVTVPGSKSVTNRALVCAALATGTSELTGVLLADDTEAMLGCLAAVGVRVKVDVTGPPSPVALVHGAAGELAPGPMALDARMSGTTARFVAPMVAVAGAGAYRLDGHPQLRRRPMTEAVRALRDLGAVVDEPGEAGHLPLVVHGRDGRDVTRVEVPSRRSSQFLSGLLLAGGALPEPATFVTDADGVSRPYLALTAAVMRAFAMDVGAVGERGAWRVAGGGYRAASYRVEPDASAASYAFAAAAVAGGRVLVEGLGRATAQGDLAFVDVLARMGCDVTVADGWTEVHRTPGAPLRGVEVDLADCSDTAQTLAVVAAVAEGPTRVTGIGFIRAKETDRIAAIVTELRRCGVEADEEPDGFVVRPRPGGVHGARVETYDDHRMAMSFAVLGLAVPGITIVDPGCVAKTFPSFFTMLDALRPGRT
jgi:3-phosphoshikimate 1-carboxyvinyltransferase